MPRFSFKPVALAIAVTTLVAGTAHASPVTFNFGGGSNTETTATLTEGPFTLNIAGFSDFNAVDFASSGGTDLGNPTNINRNDMGNGWGINGGDNGLINRGEVLNLDFGTDMVRLVSAEVFELDGIADTFVLFNGTEIIGSFDIPADPGADVELFDFSSLDYGDRAGTNFTIATASGAVRLQSLTVARVPVPGSLPLLATGLGLLGFAARRRANQAA